MIERPRVLNPDEVPDQELIVHRGAHLRDVREALKRMATGRADSPFLLYGPPGTGKTLIARDALRRLEQREDISTAYVDCWQDYRDYHLLAQVVDALGLRVVHHNSTSRSALIDALQTTEQSCVVVLDEVEMVPDAEGLRVLADASNVTVTCIVNDTTEVADTLATAWGHVPAMSQRLEFSDYTVTELIEIVSKRADHALAYDVLPETIERIAEAADGDARLGICILREAVRHAGESFGIGLNEEHLQAGVESAHRELHQSNLERLTDHQRTLYDLLKDDGPLSPGALRERYATLVDEARSKRTVITYLQKMERYGLVRSEGTTRDKTYRVDTSGYANLETA